jgi:4-alpha-glucanotransferase
LTQSRRDEPGRLRRLARLYQIQTSYLDVRDQRVDASPEALSAVLRALGVDLDGPGGVRGALEARERELWHWRLEPIILAWNGRLGAVELRLPLSEAPKDIDFELTPEAGETQREMVSLSDISPGQRHSVGDQEYVAYRLPVNRKLSLGYHRLVLRSGQQELESWIIAAPRRAYSPPTGKRWGVFLPLYALHSQRSWGIGDLTDLEGLIDWAAQAGADAVGSLPLLSTFLDDPFEPSPYAPVTRLMWSEAYIAPERVGAARPDLKNDVETAAREARRLNSEELVPYADVMALKRRVLEQQAQRYLGDASGRRELKRFADERPALGDYAAFRAALEKLGPSWRKWPRKQRAGKLVASDYDAATADYHAFAQWQAQEHMAAVAERSKQKDVRLYLDLPVGVNPDGYDAWRYQDLFVQGMSVGAPPDLLALQGQNWGFQPLNPERLRATGYRYLIDYLRHHLRVAGMLRIDHAIGLHRLWWVPEGQSAREGAFVTQPAEELYAVLSLESHRHESIIIGEDLGLVPPEVNKGLERHGVLGMYVQQFELTGKARAPMNDPRRNVLASFSTHDLSTFSAYWTCADLQERLRIGLIGAQGAEEEKKRRQGFKKALIAYLQKRKYVGAEPTLAQLFKASTALLAGSEAEWLLVSLEDTWGEVNAQNVPGTVMEQHPNWSRRARYGLEEFDEVEDLSETIKLVKRYRQAGAKKEHARATTKGVSADD